MVSPALLDRLSDDTVTKAESIRAELLRLFNTRRPARRHLSQTTVLDYGLPDWSHYDTANPDQRDQLVRSLHDAISRFEPRLCNVRITPLPRQDLFPGHLAFGLSAEMRDGGAPFTLILVATPAGTVTTEGGATP